MRELKFRIWNCVEAKWNGLYHNTPKMVGELCCLKGIYLIPESTSRNHILEQYTGLKDKNGKEIYEGDIVNYVGGMNGFSQIYEVIFSNGSFGLIHETKTHGFFTMGSLSDLQITVVGNIHENPELLKQ